MILLVPGKFFIKTFFFLLPREDFLIKKEKESFYEKFAGRQQYKFFKFAKINKIEYLAI
jgi:hypothetical protein